jgi:dihydrodipicolinate synthase/N-acetylneuraminate lyase
MSKLNLMCRVVTTFSKDGGIDEAAQRAFLQRFVDARLGVYLCSGGQGEGHTLSRDEQRRVYEIGIDVCKGKIPVYANPPEQYTAKANIELMQLAVDCGVEAVNLYAIAGWHSMRPTELELRRYYDTILSAIRAPIAIAAQPLVGYSIKPSLIADLCNAYPHISIVNLTGVPESYFFQIKPLIKRDIQYHVPISSSMHTLMLGGTGLLGTEANVIPKTYRSYIDLFEAGDYAGANKVYEQIKRYIDYTSPWNPGPIRWIKMCMKVLKMPGGEGGIREPYQMPPEEELQRFTTGLLALGIPEIDELARAAGIA